MAEDLTGKLGFDTTDFKTAIAQINRDIRVIESGFRAASSGMEDWGRTTDGLNLRITALTKEISLQDNKVKELQNEYERLADEQGENSRAAELMQVRLNKETEHLNKMKGELEKTTVSLEDLENGSDKAGNKVEELGEESDKSSEKVERLKKVVGGVGAVMKAGATAIAGLATAAAGAASAIAGLVVKTANAAGELGDLELKTGISVERLQELDYISEMVGTSQETVTSSMARMIRTIGDANEQYSDYNEAQSAAAAAGEEFTGELGQYAASFDQLGVSIYDASGNLRSSEDIFMDSVDALGEVENATLRDTLAMDIFGRSALELNPLIKAGSEEIANLSQEAHDMGAVLSEEDVRAAEEFDDKLVRMGASMEGTAAKVGIAFLPAFQGLADQAQGYLQELASVVDSADGDLGAISNGVAGLATQIVGDIAAQIPGFLQAGMTIIQTIIDAVITNLPIIIPAVISIVTSFLGFLVEYLPIIATAGIDIVLQLAAAILEMLPSIITAGIEIIIALLNGLAGAIPTLIPMIATIIPKIILTLLENLPLLIESALQLILALVAGLVEALPILIEYLPVIIQAIFDTIMTLLPIIVEAAVEIVLALITGLIDMLPTLGEAIPAIISTIVTGLIDALPSIVEAGVSIAEGIWNGISSMTEWMKEKVGGFASNILGGIKEALGINSPSKVAADEVGPEIPEGIGVGFIKRLPSVMKQVQAELTKATLSLNTPVVGGGSGIGGVTASSGGMNINLGGIHQNFTGNVDSQTVKDASRQGVLEALRAAGAI